MGLGALVGSLMLARMGDSSGKGRSCFSSAIFGVLNMSVVQLAIDSEYRGRALQFFWFYQCGS